ncbi:hypothetical protein HPP92_013167 [Vanilla planifolia]|uniref:Ubiquitinyl hydrolase 1 n=1 Tax=Vanilla planifolia TaxID=51239 RepID=A0A835UYJ2_VANPL|nr:hypothetical protein HPP92_013167 [Vanilla planifolia]
MGKKMKKKPPNTRKARPRASAGSTESVLEGSTAKISSVGEENRNAETCNHYSKTTKELHHILLNIRSSSDVAAACEHCREEPVSRKAGKDKGKQSKKKGGGTRAAEVKSDQILWVCLECGRYFCGGGVSVSEPYGHARRHAKQEHHQWAIRADNPLISWCYLCSSSITIQMPQEANVGVSEAGMNDRDGNYQGNEPLNSENKQGHTVRGLPNLGNTCFFNSVMQNLLAMGQFRDILVNLDRTFGPMTIALRMLFIETYRAEDSKSFMNPKALFGCISARAPQFRGYQQQDSHELLRYLLDGLRMEELNARKTSDVVDEQRKVQIKPGNTIVDTVFGGQLSSIVSCMECGHTSVVHEPFLDLSLPVPSKKTVPKKVPPPPPKRTKQNSRDKNKAKRFRERGVGEVSSVQENREVKSDGQSSECSESVISVPQKAYDTCLETHDMTWMDYLEASETQNGNEFGLYEMEASNLRCSNREQETEAESNSQCIIGSNVSGCSKDLTTSLDTFGQRSCTEVLDSFASISGVILLPYKELEQDLIGQEVNERAACAQNQLGTHHINISASESCATNSKCEQAEVEFDGFGDLFNEPEVTSDLKTEVNASEDMDITLLTGNINEYNEVEVDNMNARISIDSCLALFTKPEILSDEQAWYCEHCSEMLSQENKQLGSSNLQNNAISEPFVNVKSMAAEDEFFSRNLASDSRGDSANVEDSDSVNLLSSSQNVDVLVEGQFDSCAMNLSQKSLHHAERSKNSGVITGNETLHLGENTLCNNQTSCLDVLSCDKETLNSEDAQCMPTPSVIGNSLAQDVSSNGESSSNDMNDDHVLEHGDKGPERTSVSFWSDTNAAPDDTFQKVSRMRKKGLNSGKIHPKKDHNLEGAKMIKRDATKRIFIDKVPPILTIHLNRFSQDARGRLTKLNGHVGFQETLDLRPYINPRYMEDRCLYRLIGVVEHSGHMGGGHYVAYVRGDRSKSRALTGSQCSTEQAWFYASDAHVREASLTEVLQSEAYILFYEKM